MKIVVITGGTRGIGYGLAESFLARGCAVAISGRASLETASQELSSKYGAELVLAIQSDVSKFDQVQELWDKAKHHFGKVDIWINNAGIVHPRVPVWEQTPEQIQEVVATNLVGAIYGSKVAISGMLEQGFGQVYNMEGSGSGGGKVKNLSLYGTTKYAIRFLTESLVLETKGTPIVVGAISPGMVVTELLTGQYRDKQSKDWQRVKRIFNILADRVEKVTPWLVEQILANNKTGVRIAWLTPAKVIGRFLTAPLSRRDLFANEN